MAGLSLVATAGLLGTYVGYPGLRRAHAATTCSVTSTGDNDTAPYTAGELRYCLDALGTAGTGGVVTFAASANGTITLNSDLPPVTASSSVTIRGNGADATVIDGAGHGGFEFVMSGGQATLADLTVAYGYRRLGGAVLHASSAASPQPLRIENVTFSRNSAAEAGGAVFSIEAGVEVVSSTLTGNQVLTSSATFLGGGAIGTFSYTYFGPTFVPVPVTISDSTVSDNTAIFGGAVAAFGPVEVSRSTISRNTLKAGTGGVGIAGIFALGDASISNSTFYANVAASGASGTPAAVWAYGASLDVNFSTFVGNGLGAVGSTDVRASNSIFSNNASSFGTVDLYGTTIAATHSILTSPGSAVGLSLTTTDVIYGDPLLGPLADNGGPTQTMMPATDSPVLAMANPAGAPATDQRGYTRTTNGQADMGAVERRGLPPERDPSRVPPSWFQGTTRQTQDAPCPAGSSPSWGQWPNEGKGGWTCEWTTWWDVNKGVSGGWVTTPGFRSARLE